MPTYEPYCNLEELLPVFESRRKKGAEVNQFRAYTEDQYYLDDKGENKITSLHLLADLKSGMSRDLYTILDTGSILGAKPFNLPPDTPVFVRRWDLEDKEVTIGREIMNMFPNFDELGMIYMSNALRHYFMSLFEIFRTHKSDHMGKNALTEMEYLRDEMKITLTNVRVARNI